MSHLPIYMDNHAATRVDPRVVEAMVPYFDSLYGNAGSVGHAFGEQARQAVGDAQRTIAAAINAEPSEIVFTSGATESNNLAIRGIAERPRRRGNHVVSVSTEHQAVLQPLAQLAKRGCEVTLLDVMPYETSCAGLINVNLFADAITSSTFLASVMLANNEIGVIHPLAELASVCRSHGVLLHCDATQAVGKIPVDVRELGVDLMSFSSHKIYGPKGIGALFVRRTGPAPIRLEPQIAGGGQQDGIRSGTLNVAGIVGFAVAIKLCVEELPQEMDRLTDLRNHLWAGLRAKIPDVSLCGPALELTAANGSHLRLPGNLDVAFGDVDGEALLLNLPGLAVSSGAACSSTEPGPSHVLLALGMDPDLARSTLRFGLGRFNNASDVETAVSEVSNAVSLVRQLL